MNKNVAQFSEVENRIITLRENQIMIDSDVALVYGVETKHINQAVKNNPEKFPDGYVLYLSETEKTEVVKIFDHLHKLKFSRQLPKGFTEKGLYMLATILKSEKATQTTIAIIECFAKIKELGRTVSTLSETNNKSIQKTLVQKSSELFLDLLGDEQKISGTETTIELNFAVLKLKHTVKRKNENEN